MSAKTTGGLSIIAQTLLKTAAAWLLIMPVLMMACTPWDKEELDGPGGSGQSPVNIRGWSLGGLPACSFEYSNDGNQLTNDGKFVKVKFNGDSHIILDGLEYTLAEAHWHNPSEHTVEGERFALEMHLVHRRGESEIAVVGVLYRLGQANAAIQTLIDMGPQPGQNMESPSPLEATAYLPEKNSYYRYSGSLTTPPYTEGVKWMVMSEIQEISREQVQQLAALTGGGTNSRPLQPMGNRGIRVYESP